MVKLSKQTKKNIFVIFSILFLLFPFTAYASSVSLRAVSPNVVLNSLPSSSVTLPDLGSLTQYDLSYNNSTYFYGLSFSSQNSLTSSSSFNRSNAFWFAWGIRGSSSGQPYIISNPDFSSFVLSCNCTFNMSTVSSSSYSFAYDVFLTDSSLRYVDFSSYTPIYSYNFSIDPSQTTSFNLICNSSFVPFSGDKFLSFRIRLISYTGSAPVVSFYVSDVSFYSYGFSSPSYSGNDIFSLPSTVGDVPSTISYDLSSVNDYTYGYVSDGRSSLTSDNVGVTYDDSVISYNAFDDSIAYSWGTYVRSENSSPNLFYWIDQPSSARYKLRVLCSVDNVNARSNYEPLRFYGMSVVSAYPLYSDNLLYFNSRLGFQFNDLPYSDYKTYVIQESNVNQPQTLVFEFTGNLVGFSSPSYLSFGIYCNPSLDFEREQLKLTVDDIQFSVYDYPIEPDPDSPIPEPEPDPTPSDPDLEIIDDNIKDFEDKLTEDGKEPSFEGDHINDYFIDNSVDEIDSLVIPFDDFFNGIADSFNWFKEMWRTLLGSDSGFPGSDSPFLLLTPAALFLILRSVIGR